MSGWVDVALIGTVRDAPPRLVWGNSRKNYGVDILGRFVETGQDVHTTVLAVFLYLRQFALA